MNLAGQLQSAARQLNIRGAQAAELLAASTHTALETLSHKRSARLDHPDPRD